MNDIRFTTNTGTEQNPNFVFEAKSALISKIVYSYGIHDEKKVSEIITVHFVNGGINEYKKPVRVVGEQFDMEGFFKEFIRSVSVGKFWHQFVKDKFETKRIK